MSTTLAPDVGAALRPSRSRTSGWPRRRLPGASLLQRPELGALLGALVVCVVLLRSRRTRSRRSAASRSWTDVASTLGIMAVAVALLMIGGEFDLSSGVMTGTTGLLMGLLTTEWGFTCGRRSC